MHHTPIPAISDAPQIIRRLARDRSIHDTSSSPEARVYALGAEGASSNALFAKTAPAGTLAQEARMSTVFHELGLGPEVVEYLPGGGTHASPRPHMRRAHWHLYWTGTGRAVPRVKWIAPVFVRGEGADTPVVTHTVKE